MAKTDPTFEASRVSLRPIEYANGATVYGHYRVATVTGATVSLTANDPILSFRWTSSEANAVLLRLGVSGQITSNITTAVGFDLEAVIARGFTASDSAGTAVTVANFQKARTSMGSSLVGDFRVATTGKLTAGTRTLDSYGFGRVNIATGPTVTNAGSMSLPVDLYKADVSGIYPVTLKANEGFIVTAPIAANTSGAIRYTFTVEWAEVPVSDAF